jgi:hypothetical protein
MEIVNKELIYGNYTHYLTYSFNGLYLVYSMKEEPYSNVEIDCINTIIDANYRDTIYNVVFEVENLARTSEFTLEITEVVARGPDLLVLSNILLTL